MAGPDSAAELADLRARVTAQRVLLAVLLVRLAEAVGDIDGFVRRVIADAAVVAGAAAPEPQEEAAARAGARRELEAFYREATRVVQLGAAAGAPQ